MATIRRLDDTQAEFAEGTLVGVQATDTPSLALAYKPVLSFDGVDDYVDCGNSYIGDGSFTVEFWVKTTSTNGRFVCKDSDSSLSGINGMWGIEPITGGKLRFFYRGATTVILDGLTSINDNIWHHIACVRNPSIGIRRIYIDGNLDTELISGDTTVYSVNSNITLGGELPNSFEHNNTQCVLSELKIWNTARTQQQIQDNMYRELTGTEPGLVAYYKMNEGNGTTIIDSAGTNNGTIYGATWVNNTNYKFFGYRVTPPLDCTDLTSISSSSVSWTETLNSGTIIIETRVSTDNGNTWTAWTQVTNGGSIPNIAPGCLVECRQNLSTTDISKTPELTSLDIEINRVTTTLMFACNF